MENPSQITATHLSASAKLYLQSKVASYSQPSPHSPEEIIGTQQQDLKPQVSQRVVSCVSYYLLPNKENKEM